MLSTLISAVFHNAIIYGLFTTVVATALNTSDKLNTTLSDKPRVAAKRYGSYIYTILRLAAR